MTYGHRRAPLGNQARVSSDEGRTWSEPMILSGGGDWQRGETDAVTAHVLSIANLDRPMVVLLSEGERERGYELLESYTRLGGPGGEVVILDFGLLYAEDVGRFARHRRGNRLGERLHRVPRQFRGYRRRDVKAFAARGLDEAFEAELR